jgi:hypothetical protein
MRRFLLAIALTATAALSASEAVAQVSACDKQERIADTLLKMYGEKVQGGGYAPALKAIVMLFANLETGSWTLVITKPDKTACIMMGGSSYKKAPIGQPI